MMQLRYMVLFYIFLKTLNSSLKTLQSSVLCYSGIQESLWERTLWLLIDTAGISKRHFLKDIENFFHEVTPIGLKPHQNFSFDNISTNIVARDVSIFGQNGPWLLNCLSYGQNFFAKFAKTCYKQILKISRR